MQATAGKKRPSFSEEQRAQIGARLRELRLAQGPDGMLQSEMADRIGITASHYTKIERGRNFVSERLLRDIARTFGVTYEWLAFGDDQMPQLRETPPQYGPSREPVTPEDSGLRAIARAVLAGDAIGKADQVASILGIDREKALAIVLANLKQRGDVP